MINRPNDIGAFKFAVLSSLRAAQLCRGCLPRIEGDHSVAITAQMEVAAGAVVSDDLGAPAVTDVSAPTSPIPAMTV